MTRGNYDKIAPLYDLLDYPFEKLIYSKMRYQYLSKLQNKTILEIGVGTGKNLPYYDKSNEIIGIDVSKPMLKVAHSKKNKCKAKLSLSHVDDPPYKLSTNSIDVIVCTFVLYTTDSAPQIVNEMERLLHNGGSLIIFEFKPPKKRLYQIITHLLNPITKSLFGVDFFNISTPSLFDNKWKVKVIDYYFEDLIYATELILNKRYLKSKFSR